MTPHDSSLSGSSTSSSACSSTSTKPPDHHLDHLLAGAGYKVRSNDLHQVADRLQRLETAMVKSDISELVNETVHYNPTDLASWVDSLLTELNTNPSDLPDPYPVMTNAYATNHAPHPHQELPQQQQQQLPMGAGSVVPAPMEEDVSIQLVHVLMTCAEAVQRGDLALAGLLIDDLQALLTRVNSGCGIGKVGSFFVDALSRRIVSAPSENAAADLSAYENEILYHHYYEACPYLKFAHFTANQAILEAFEGQDCVHVIDFNLMQGLQWPALIQALALRPGGPPLLRLTGIGPPSPDGRDSLREIGLKLAELARSVNVRFAFRGVAASRLDDVKPWMLQVSPKEAVAVNSIMQLHRLLGPNGTTNGPPIDLVLDWIRDLNPRILMVVEQESNHNQPEFLDRFTEALYYYSTMFDSLDVCTAQPEKALAELYIQREICNVVCCEGSVRVERHEPLVRWRERLINAGFAPLHLGSNAFKQARMLLTLFSAEGYSVEENEGCLTLGWHSRPLIAASAWQAIPKPSPTMGPINHP